MPVRHRRPEVWKICSSNTTSWGMECDKGSRVSRRPLLEVIDAVEADLFLFQEHRQSEFQLAD
eukprot:1811779-Pyramimonas_sp.AAC.1